MRHYVLPLLLLSLVILFLTGCESKVTQNTKSLHLSVSNLKNLGTGARYEAWVLVGQDWHSIGRFAVDAEGNLPFTDFAVDEDLVNNATKFRISVEPNPDTNTACSGSIILLGSFINNRADLGVSDSTSIGNNLSWTVGRYTLATPTDTNSLNERSGIWFMTPHGDPGLDIPTLNSHWKYEAWAEIDGQILSMGKFSRADTLDTSSTYCATINPVPNRPGEDFLTHAPEGLSFPLSLEGKRIFITVEPEPDYSPSPFFITPLETTVAVGAGPNLQYLMTANTSCTPSGIVTR